jgi:hypothetical protein
MRIVETFRIIDNEPYADVTWHLGWMGLWSYAELALGIIVACALSLPKLAKHTRRKLSSNFSWSLNTTPSAEGYGKHERKDFGKVNVLHLGQTLSQTNLTTISETEDVSLTVLHSGLGGERV